MGVVRAPVQTVEEIYRLVWAAVANKQLVEAVYQGRLRLFCPHRLGRNREGRLRVYCATSTAAIARADSSLSVRLQTGVVLSLEKLSRVNLIEDVWRTAPNHSRPTSCVAEADIDAEDHPARDPQKGQ